MRPLVLALALALLTSACGGDAPSREECVKVVDHMIDLMVAPRAQDKETVLAVDAWKKQLKSVDPSRQTLMSMCTKAMQRSHVDCIMEAKDENALAKCLGG